MSGHLRREMSVGITSPAEVGRRNPAHRAARSFPDRSRPDRGASQDRPVGRGRPRGTAIARELGIHHQTVRLWLRRFNKQGIPGLEDRPRSGWPPTYTSEEVGEVVATSLTDPRRLGLPFASWTLDRLESSLNTERGITRKRRRLDEILLAEGSSADEARRAGSARGWTPRSPRKGRITTRSAEAPERSAVEYQDELGPEGAKGFPGQQLVRARPDSQGPRPAERARQETDDGRRGKGYGFGAFPPSSGEAFTMTSPGGTTANFVDFLEPVEDGIPVGIRNVSALLDHLRAHRATDVLWFSLAHSRWEFIFPPKSATDLNPIESWWKVLRSLALKGQRFASLQEVCEAVRESTADWDAHRHPFRWDQRRRCQPRRQPGSPFRQRPQRLGGCTTRGCLKSASWVAFWEGSWLRYGGDGDARPTWISCRSLRCRVGADRALDPTREAGRPAGPAPPAGDRRWRVVARGVRVAAAAARPAALTGGRPLPAQLAIAGPAAGADLGLHQ